jgi:hypothetical protein
MAHELTHVLVARLDPTVEAWLTEGAAVYEEAHWSPTAYRRFNEAAWHNVVVRARPLPALTALADEAPFLNPGRTGFLAYAESESVVAFMVQRAGRAGLVQFIKDLGQGQSQDAASLAVFGMPLDALFAAWQARVAVDQPPF